MVDFVSLSVATAGLGAAVVAGYGVYVQRGQLRTAREQVAAAMKQLEAEEAKIDALGRLVDALMGLVEAQKNQLEAFRQSLRLQEDSIEVARMDAAVRVAQFDLERANPIDKAAAAVKEVWDRGIQGASSWWDRNIRRRRRA